MLTACCVQSCSANIIPRSIQVANHIASTHSNYAINTMHPINVFSPPKTETLNLYPDRSCGSAVLTTVTSTMHAIKSKFSFLIALAQLALMHKPISTSQASTRCECIVLVINFCLPSSPNVTFQPTQFRERALTLGSLNKVMSMTRTRLSMSFILTVLLIAVSPKPKL